MTDMKRRERGPAVENRRRKAGETLTETLVALLMIGLSSVLFMTMTGASGRIFRKAEKAYEEIYEEISKADLQKGSPSDDDIGTITVQGSASVTVDVDWYGSTDYVLSYKVKR